jgi:hypothetical protein
VKISTMFGLLAWAPAVEDHESSASALRDAAAAPGQRRECQPAHRERGG